MFSLMQIIEHSDVNSRQFLIFSPVVNSPVVTITAVVFASSSLGHSVALGPVLRSFCPALTFQRFGT